MKKILFIAALISLFTFHFSLSSAQQLERYYNRPFAHLGVTLGAGLDAFLYQIENGKASPGLTLDLGTHYTHFFSSFGVGLGIHLSSAKGSALYNLDEVTTGLTHANNPGAHYNLTTRYNDWRERQSISLLSLPLEAFYRISTGGGRHFITGLGFQFDIPIRGKYSPADGSYTTIGHFPVGGPHTISDMPEHGFSTYSETFGASITNLKLGISVILDAGLHIPLGYTGGLYIGIFGGIGLTSILDPTDPTASMLTINADDPSLIDYYGTFAAIGNPSLRLLRIGLKLGIDIGSPMDN